MSNRSYASLEIDLIARVCTRQTAIHNFTFSTLFHLLAGTCWQDGRIKLRPKDYKLILMQKASHSSIWGEVVVVVAEQNDNGRLYYTMSSWLIGRRNNNYSENGGMLGMGPKYVLALPIMLIKVRVNGGGHGSIIASAWWWLENQWVSFSGRVRPQSSHHQARPDQATERRGLLLFNNRFIRNTNQ